MRESILDLMAEKLLPYMSYKTPEFTTFNYAVNSYVQGNKKRLLEHLECLRHSYNKNIATAVMAVIIRARLENF